MALLPGIAGPADVQRLDPSELPVLAAEIRDLLISSVSRTGGHLGPNLGAVELTIALHRVFTSPRDRILFDTGHQAYVHKMLTGRADRFDTLRKEGGLSGYPSAAESEHDVIENSHASTALSYADGLAKAYRLRGEKRPVDRRRRRRRADRRHVLGGAEQHRRLRPAGHHRRQRQRPVLRPDHRRARRAPGAPAAEPAVRARARRGALALCRGRRWSARRCTRRCTASSAA